MRAAPVVPGPRARHQTLLASLLRQRAQDLHSLCSRATRSRTGQSCERLFDFSSLLGVEGRLAIVVGSLSCLVQDPFTSEPSGPVTALKTVLPDITAPCSHRDCHQR